MELLRYITALTFRAYLIGAFLGNSFKPKDWDTAGKLFLVIIYLFLILVIVINNQLKHYKTIK